VEAEVEEVAAVEPGKETKYLLYVSYHYYIGSNDRTVPVELRR